MDDKMRLPVLLTILLLLSLVIIEGYVGKPPQIVTMVEDRLLINSIYVKNDICEDRLLYIVLLNNTLRVKLEIPKSFYEVEYNYTCTSTPVLYFEEKHNRIVLSKIECGETHSPNIVMCETRSCHFIIYHNHTRTGEIDVEYPGICYGETPPARECAWWDIGCHILNALRAIWDWIRNAIWSALPSWLRDLFTFVSGLTMLVVTIADQLVELSVYFIFTILLFMTLGIVYYTIEHGVVGLGKFFHDLYEILRKIVSFILQIIEAILP